MATPEPKAQAKPARRVSINISVSVPDIEQLDAIALENAVRDAADEFAAQVFASYGTPINIQPGQ